MRPRPIAPPVHAAVFPTAFGPCGLLWTPAGLRALLLPERREGALRRRLEALAPEAAGPLPAAASALIGRVQAQLGGEPQHYEDVLLDQRGIGPFASRVYQALRTVAWGETITYGELAARVGAPKAARAVGQAVGRNPWPLVVPCQRVLGARGALGGYSAPGGVATKRRLLALEGSAPSAPAAAALLPPVEPPASLAAIDSAHACAQLSAQDPELGSWIARLGPFGLEFGGAASTFSALAEAIVYQQLTGKAAATIYGRLTTLAGHEGELDPARLLAASDEQLRGAGLSRAKLRALRELAERAASAQLLSLAELRQRDDEAVVAELQKLRGIGRWTAEMLLIFQLGRPDVLPSSDYGVRKGFARAFGGELPSAEALQARALRWRPYRSVASWYLWRVAEAPPLP